MPRDFSIEQAMERIVHPRTREYFGEVYSSYVNGNYRSAVVGLWSVAVCDLLYKMDDLRTTHADDTAREIIEAVKARQESNPKSPDWESELVKLVADKTVLLEPADRENLRHLQHERHLAAHPILSVDFTLHSPTHETVRALLRSTLEGVLTKPPLLSKKVLDALVEDLENKKAVLPSEQELQRYLEAKYSSLPLSTALAVFRGLWKLVFRLEDQRCANNRQINFRTLCFFYDCHPREAKDKIAEDRDFFSNVSGDPKLLTFLIGFISERPEIFNVVTDVCKALVRGAGTTNQNMRALAWFAHNVSLLQHVQSLVDEARCTNLRIESSFFKRLLRTCRANEEKHAVYLLGALQYCHSGNFDEADLQFAQVVNPYLEDWDRSVFDELVTAVADNGQCYGRGRAKAEHRQVREVYERRFNELLTLPANETVAETFRPAAEPDTFEGGTAPF